MTQDEELLISFHLWLKVFQSQNQTGSCWPLGGAVGMHQVGICHHAYPQLEDEDHPNLGNWGNPARGRHNWSPACPGAKTWPRKRGMRWPWLSARWNMVVTGFLSMGGFIPHSPGLTSKYSKITYTEITHFGTGWGPQDSVQLPYFSG